VLAELLTYRIDIPQEGRIAQAVARHGVDMRVGIFPTIHGERAVIRLFDRAGSTIGLEQLGLPAFILQPLLGTPARAIRRDSSDRA
jgi:type II secretory ATPase GspE/PulE/Tfp pilus assembly ATPase PilB-like protein